MAKRIILHWSAGRYFPSSFEKNYYHYLVDVEGNIYQGFYTPEDNDNCQDGKYAMHTGGGNTGSIGVCMCGMYGFKSQDNPGVYPISKIQFEACMKFCAQLCDKHNIEVTTKTVMTHYEFGVSNPKTSSAGKIDIIWLPPYPWVARKDVGSFIRSKIRWYMEHYIRG